MVSRFVTPESLANPYFSRFLPSHPALSRVSQLSCLFTLISAVLAFSRTFVFTLIAMLVLPVILGVTGIWLATPAAELAAVVLSAVMLLKYRRRYCY